MKIYVNGEQRHYAENIDVAQVVAELGLQGKRIAVELNQEILPFDQYKPLYYRTKKPSHLAFGLEYLIGGEG